MRALASPSAAFQSALSAVGLLTVRTHNELCGVRFQRDPQDIARDQWMAERLPVVVAAMEQSDAQLARGFDDVRWSAPILDAYRAGDALEFLRLVQNAVRQELAHDADLAVEEEAYERFPEGA